MSGAQITLITGQPGSGKTAKTVHMIQDEIAKGRVVFVLGIPGLTLPFVPMPPVKEWTVKRSIEEDETIQQAHLNFPDGCLLVIDEAQKIYRPRGVSSAVPDHVAALETHRHHGIDIWLLTQHYTFIDSNVRKLVKRHIHCRDHWTGWKTYERGEAFDHDSPTERKVAAVEAYKPPKEVFHLYTSSSKHVKRVRKIPKWVYGVPILLGVSGFLAYRAYFATIDRTAREAAPVADSAAHPPRIDKAGSPAAVGTPPARAGQRGGAVEPADFEPRINTRPESAPIYDQLRQVKALPYVAGCAAIRERCICYTAQGTDAFLTADQCREWLRKPPFNPWIEPEKTPVPARQVQPPQMVASAGTVIEAPAKPAELSSPEAPSQLRTPRVPASSPWRAP